MAVRNDLADTGAVPHCSRWFTGSSVAPVSPCDYFHKQIAGNRIRALAVVNERAAASSRMSPALDGAARDAERSHWSTCPE